MPPQSPPTNATKFNLYYGHRKPSHNRPTVHGGDFTDRQTINPNKTFINRNPNPAFDIDKWDPQSPNFVKTPITKPPYNQFYNATKTLTPIARYICDAFRKHKSWCPDVVTELNKLRRVTPKLVAEVLKVQTDHRISSRFFHWAGKQKGYKHDFAAYNALAYCLNRTKQFQVADELPDLMNRQGKPPSEQQFEILIRMHVDNNRGLRLYYVYEKMKKFGVNPRVFLYNKIMDGLVRTRHLDLAMSVYEDFKEDKLAEESLTFMILIKGLCKAGRIDEALGLLGKMRSKLCKPDVFAYTAMVKVLVSEGNLDGCLRVWVEMKKDRVVPDVMAFATLVTGLCKGNRVEEAYEFFNEMKTKGYLIDRSIYRSLIEAFVSDRKIGSALDLLKDLMDSGYRADLSIYNTLIEGLCNVERVDKAHKLFLVTTQESLEPDFGTVSPMLVAYAEMGDTDKFISLLEQMQKLGFSVIDDLSKFFSVMVEKEARIMPALEIFEALKVKGYTSISIYNVLMEALLKTGEVKQALFLFNELKDMNLNPDSSTYSNVLTCFVEVGDIHEAITCYYNIKEMSQVPSVPAYCSLVRGICKIGEFDAAITIVRDCLANVTSGPMEFKYALTILHVCKSGLAEKVIEVIDEMIEQGVVPNEIIYSAVISGMCKCETIEEGKKVFSIMRERKLLTEADLVVYEDMLIEHLQKKTADLVLSGLKFFGLDKKLKNKGCTLLLR